MSQETQTICITRKENKRLFDSQMKNGYLSSPASDSEKIAFVKFYVERICSDITVIAENLPHDQPYIHQLGSHSSSRDSAKSQMVTPT